MKKESVQQEIILVATTSFSSREWCNNDNRGSKNLSSMEKLEEACWNGLLEESLPEIVEKTESGKSLYLWHIRHGRSFLQIELCEFPVAIEKRYSIDSRAFLETVLYN
jgi:hypothetical protein